MAIAGSPYHRMRKQFLHWYKRSTCHMITEDLYLLLLLRPHGFFLKVANPTFFKKQMRKFMKQSESAPIRSILSIYGDHGKLLEGK